MAFKHVLLPVWIAAYRYRGKVFRFLVNGQTGEIVGQAPWSIPKIAALVILVLAIIGGAIALAHANARPAGAPLPPARPAAHHQGR